MSRVTVCWKWVRVDGGSDPDARWAGVSAADEAALEIGLRLAGEGGSVTVVCAGPSGSEDVLRLALAVGADEAVRIDCTDASSTAVAVSIVAIAAGADFVVCGDYSIDRGSGSVPAFIAHHLGAQQALGLVDLDIETGIDSVAVPLRVTRRLDGGRRELLDVTAPAVLSVEGSVARLRRASLAATLRAKQAEVRVVPGPPPEVDDAIVTAFRPRPRVVPPPSGSTLSRLRDILNVGSADVGRAETVHLEPAAAAERVLDQLRAWGYLDQSD